ncbi:OmpP1/FadL family transporter [Saccharicrinis sp. FJH54]|uniref:OmpP1/FadL family transporter n=1 Tax=Saccharicrinis sp. FJH54 TaxID=3344665 RepID=UPI0035D3E555
MKKLIAACVAVLMAASGMAQTLNDAYNLSSVTYGSTARSAAMGGAFGALGADFSSISINPAGLGVYRGGEFTFTPNFYLNSSSSDYLGTVSDDKKVGLNFNNLGLVFATPTLKDQGVMSVNFAIGYNRLKDFHRVSYTQGNNSLNSQLTYYAHDLAAYGEQNSLWSSYLAYQGWLVDKYTNTDNQVVYESILLSDTKVDQTQSVFEKGKLDEWNFAMALNINHKVYVGASFGIRDVYYRKELMYKEAFGITPNGSYSQWDDASQSYIFYDNGGFVSNDYLTTSGYGFNGKLGVIAKPVDALRLGVSIHTPTYYVLEDNYSYSIDPDVLHPVGADDVRPDIQNSDDLSYKYVIYSSPLNLEFSMAYVFGKYGVFSLDYGISDYGGMTIHERGSSTGTFINTNQMISDVMNTGTSLRAGLELKASPNFSLRGGFARYSSPLNTTKADSYSFDKAGALNQYSAGFGYRDNDFFIDFAYVLQNQNVESSLFILDNSAPTAMTKYNSNKVMMTVGFRF